MCRDCIKIHSLPLLLFELKTEKQMPNIHISEDKDTLARDFAGWMLELVLQHKGDFHISLSGGSTPKKLFDLLAAEYADKFPWERIHFWWGDERMVPADDPESNYGMTKLRLFMGISIPQSNIHRIRGEEDPDEEAIRYAREIEAFVGDGKGKISFDLMVLGMGDDGHTASIFPDNLEALELQEPTFVARHPESGQVRVSMTQKLINDSKNIAFLVAGESKKEKFRAIVEGRGAEKYPAYYIKALHGQLHWFVDKAAHG